MDFDRLSGDLKDLRRRNRGLALAVGALATGVVLALIVILNLLGTVRTVIVPAIFALVGDHIWWPGNLGRGELTHEPRERAADAH